VLGAGGHLSGPFARVDADQQAAAIISLLELRDDISLPDPRSTVPEMARLAGRHPRLNLMNLEAVALGHLLSATVWLSRESAEGILPGVLDHELVRWRTVTIVGATMRGSQIRTFWAEHGAGRPANGACSGKRV